MSSRLPNKKSFPLILLDPQTTLLDYYNPPFADYQPHNSNVLSVVDTFSYSSGQKLTAATASYYEKSRADRLQDLNMMLKSAISTDDWSQFKDSTRLFCHRALYNVKWDVDNKPQTVLADKYAEALNKASSIAVGTTSLDALAAYITAQRSSSDDNSSEKVKEIEETIFAMQPLLHAHDGGVDARLEAADQTDDDDDPKTTQPPEEIREQVETLNKLQTQLDLIMRTQQQTRWDLFSLWWKCITNSTRDDSKYKNDVQIQSNYIEQLQTLANSLQSDIGNLEKGFISKARPKIPSTLRTAAEALITEFVALGQDDDGSSSSSSSSSSTSETEVYPQYRDQGWNASNYANAPWRDSWGDTQPWFPLIVEWEVEYTHPIRLLVL
ncbi:hypothetical protein AJ80_09204 [Polytolypa hystricis UAMH7299]|uniref:Uncharacterized protein n=1 Tax=Polytolypa hystricis (strain UAMH7299) TaxID=1447883 RepID=A0A2B7WTR7_POLH7|nr:hypothetical protein AJ80_09204 [Polytolypa hystricis UAMH7299]